MSQSIARAVMSSPTLTEMRKVILAGKPRSATVLMARNWHDRHLRTIRKVNRRILAGRPRNATVPITLTAPLQSRSSYDLHAHHLSHRRLAHLIHTWEHSTTSQFLTLGANSPFMTLGLRPRLRRLEMRSTCRIPLKSPRSTQTLKTRTRLQRRKASSVGCGRPSEIRCRCRVYGRGCPFTLLGQHHLHHHLHHRSR